MINNKFILRLIFLVICIQTSFTSAMADSNQQLQQAEKSMSKELQMKQNQMVNKVTSTKDKQKGLPNNFDLSSVTDYKSLLSNKPSYWYSMIRKRPNSFHALRYDPRVSYTVYAPTGFFDDPTEYKLLVSVHGSGRNAAEYRDSFSKFANENKFVVLSPLFPVGINGDGFSDGYKVIQEGNTRYDVLLLKMIEDLQEASNYDFGKFYLFGFSGGGQFTHRFFYLHPDKLSAVSIGAPGLIAKIDNRKVWPFGTGDMKKKFGTILNLKKMREVSVQIIVGEEDLEEFIIPDKLKPLVQKIIGHTGKNRLERMKILKENYENNGISPVFKIVPGVSHEGMKVIDDVQEFFKDSF